MGRPEPDGVHRVMHTPSLLIVREIAASQRLGPVRSFFPLRAVFPIDLLAVGHVGWGESRLQIRLW